MPADLTEVLVSLVYTLLSKKNGISAEFLRSRVDRYQNIDTETFQRYFARDKGELERLGIPIETIQREDTNGRNTTFYRILPEKYRLDEIEFSAPEAAAIAMAASYWGEDALGNAAQRALARLGVESTELEHSVFEPRVSSSEPAFGQLLEAITEHFAVTFTYANPVGEQSVRVLEPWGLGQRFGHWYVTGWDLDRQAQRIFRLSRILDEVKRAANEFTHERPSDFSMREALNRMKLDTGTSSASIELREGRGYSLRTRAEEIVESEEGWDRLTVRFDNVEDMAKDVAALGNAARVLEPDSLKRATSSLVERALEAHRTAVPTYELRKPKKSAGRIPETVKVARALDMVSYIHDHGGATFAELSEHFDLDRRTLQSELERLSLCGLPGGLHDELLDVIIVGDDVNILNAEHLNHKVRLNLAEAFSLMVALELMSAVPGVGDDSVVESARSKIETATGHFSNLSNAITARFVASEDPERWSQLYDAIENHRVTRLKYISGGRDALTDRVIWPVRLKEQTGRIYLQAWCTSANAPRVFRMDRVRSLTVLDEHFADDAAELAQVPTDLYSPLANADDVVVKFGARLRPLLPEFTPTKVSTKQSDGSVIAEISSAGDQALRDLVTSHAGHFEVVAPPEKRQEIKEWLEDASKMHAESGNQPS